MEYIIARLKEPSSIAGIGLIFTAIPMLMSNPQNAAAIAMLLSGIGAIIVPEKKA